MTIKTFSNLVVDRQWRLTILADINVLNAPKSIIKLPPDTFLLSGFYYVITAATGTTPTLSMVDSQASPVTLLSAVSIATVNATGNIAGSGTPRYYPAAQSLTFSVGGTTPAGGRVIISLDYVVLGRGNEFYGADGS